MNDKTKSRIQNFFGKLTGANRMQEEIDTLTWLKDIKPGISAETYTDVPAIVPFPVEGSDRAVIIIPGGGYVYTGDITEPNTAETDLLAKQFNERGISAFVLGYRCNPYKMPIPLLDMQRAVRWLRFHSEDYGFDPDKIALFGGSAGGYQAAGFLNLLQGKNQFPEDYTPDEIDMVKDIYEMGDPQNAFVNVKAKVIYNSKQGDIINQYITFSRVFDRQVKQYGYTKEAVEETLRVCRDQDVLSGFLADEEVANIMFTFVDEKRARELWEEELKTEAKEEGIREGIAKGKEEGIREGIAKGKEEGKEEGIKEGIAKGKEAGRREGIAEGKNEEHTKSLLGSIYALMETLKMTAAQAMDALKVSPEDRKKLSSMI